MKPYLGSTMDERIHHKVADQATSLRKVVCAGAVGTLIEYYDYTVYAFLATTIASIFFSDTEGLALLYTFAVFGVSFVVRPIGGIALGALADRYGRKPALLVSVVGIIGATLLIGLLPTYASAGIMAPILLCALRCVQGLAAAGELGAAVSYVAELAPEGRRGALTSTTQIGCLLGTMGGALAVALLHSFTTPQQLLSWGWRIPFLVSAPLGIVAILTRKRMEETPDFQNLKQHKRVEKAPTIVVLRSHMRSLITITCIAAGAHSGYYLTFAYLVTYFQKQGIMTAQAAGWSSTAAMLIGAAMVYPFGKLSDRIGRRKMLTIITSCFIILTYPLFIAMNTSAAMAVAAQIVLGLIEAAYLATAFATYCEQFPARVRTSGINLGFNIAAIIGGGFSPYVATWLIAKTSLAASPAWILIFFATGSFVVVRAMQETAHKPMEISG
ncbi:MFS transporter [Paraburkholderia sediminicola]|uniref:MFS transporter n=1 Tax=Paraburkholderia sediminicola TaxID=458836 RepID=UPI000EAF721E